MLKHYITYISCMILLFLLASCAIQGNKNTGKEETLKDSVQDDNRSIVLTDTVAVLAEIKSQQAFAYSVYERISKEYKGNMVCSPLGIEVLYSILRDGAKGETYNELNKVLGISHAEASSMMKDIELPSDTTGTTIDMANLIAVNKPYSLKQAFASNAKRDYGAEIWSKPFNGKALADINRWIEKQTNGMIPNGLDNWDASAVMCGINTIFFNGKWQNPFDEANTKPAVFTDITGKKSKVMMMSQKAHFRYMKTESFQTLVMPYKLRASKGAKMKNYSLYVFLPLEGEGPLNEENKYSFAPIIKYLKTNIWGKFQLDLRYYGASEFDNNTPLVNVKFPQMEISTETDVASLMKSLGVKSAFEPDANFNGISKDKIMIDQSKQKAVIRIDEKGTKAAAMTSSTFAIGGMSGIRPKQAFFYATHPFIYMIVCEDTNTILFIGQYTHGKIKNESGEWVTDHDISDAEEIPFHEDNEKADIAPDRCLVANKVEVEAHHDANYVYDVCERMPNFPGGMSQLMSYIKKNIRYPVDAVKDGTQGRVILTFIVEKDGRLTDIKVAKSVSPSLDKEALRMVKSMPRWIPGMQDGKKVRAKYTLPISFKLDGMPMKKH